MPDPTFTTPPDAPSRAAPSTFSSRTDAFLAWFVTFKSELTTAVSWFSSTAATVSADASITTAAKDAAIAASNAEPWASAASYMPYDVVISPVDYQPYRAITTHSGVTTDPSLDATNWSKQFVVPEFTLPSEYVEFLSSGTWTKPAGVTWVYVEVIGGGSGALMGGAYASSYGGGGGGFSSRIFLASDLAATEAVTIGAGGVSNATAASITTGGDTTFGSHITGGGGGSTAPGAGYRAVAGGTLNGPHNAYALNLSSPGGWASGVGGYGTQTPQGGGSIKGGAGGSAGSAFRVGGISLEGGNGGNASSSNASGESNGVQPGGGAGFHNTGTPSVGGDGRCRVWAW